MCKRASGYRSQCRSLPLAVFWLVVYSVPLRQRRLATQQYAKCLETELAELRALTADRFAALHGETVKARGSAARRRY